MVPAKRLKLLPPMCPLGERVLLGYVLNLLPRRGRRSSLCLLRRLGVLKSVFQPRRRLSKEKKNDVERYGKCGRKMRC